MEEYTRFGIPMPMFRTDYGTLRSREMEKIRAFLEKRGILVGRYLDGYTVISHPGIVNEIKDFMEESGFWQVMMGATLESIRQAMKLTVAEIRALEELSPGPLVIMRDETQEAMAVSVPDSFDLRDICSLYNGATVVYLCKNKDRTTDIADIARKLSNGKIDGVRQVGILESPLYEEDPIAEGVTVARIIQPGKVECLVKGDLDAEMIAEATKKVSQWEMGEWI